MAGLAILIIGDAARSEFEEPLSTIYAEHEVHCAPDVETARALMVENSFTPDVLVVAQAFPNQFTETEIEELLRLAPLARVVSLLGAWCEGESRSGKPWPSTARLYWHQWPCRVKRQLFQLAEGRKCAWSLPLTATEEEQLLAEFESNDGHGRSLITSETASEQHPGLVIIRTHSRETWELLSMACHTLGFSAVWQRDASPLAAKGAQVIIFDSGGPEEEIERLKCFVGEIQPVPVIALWSFPRIEDYRKLQAAGAAAILSKPFLITDLSWLLIKLSTSFSAMQSQTS